MKPTPKRKQTNLSRLSESPRLQKPRTKVPKLMRRLKERIKTRKARKVVRMRGRRGCRPPGGEWRKIQRKKSVSGTCRCLSATSACSESCSTRSGVKSYWRNPGKVGASWTWSGKSLGQVLSQNPRTKQYSLSFSVWRDSLLCLARACKSNGHTLQKQVKHQDEQQRMNIIEKHEESTASALY